MEKMEEQDILQRVKKLEGWKYSEGALQTAVKCTDFKEAFALMTRIAFECETQNHHPEWTNVYNTIEIALNTHDANGITLKDFKLAESIQHILSDH